MQIHQPLEKDDKIKFLHIEVSSHHSKQETKSNVEDKIDL